MTEINLSASTGNAYIDNAVRRVGDVFETAFPQRIRSYYVEGSYADGTEVPTSDVDLTIVFKDRFGDDTERNRAAQVADRCAAMSSVELDVEIAYQDEDIQRAMQALKERDCHST